MSEWLYIVRIISLLGIALAYALFDLFNKREVPNLFAYGSVAVAFALCMAYWNIDAVIGIGIALLITGAGYLVYKKGFLGAGDVLELVAIALLLPLQPAPILSHAPQLGMPFVLSVFLSSGYFAIILLVLYYMIFARRSSLEKGFKTEKPRLIFGVVLIIAYILLVAMMYVLTGISIIGMAILLLLAIFSSIMFVFEKLMNYRMISMLYPRELTPDDMIAINLMGAGDLRYFRHKSKSFGRLATAKLIKDLRSERKKLPVYRNAAPLAAFFFMGVVFSLLFGNLIFLIM